MVEAEEEYVEQLEILISCFLRPFKVISFFIYFLTYFFLQNNDSRRNFTWLFTLCSLVYKHSDTIFLTHRLYM